MARESQLIGRLPESSDALWPARRLDDLRNCRQITRSGAFPAAAASVSAAPSRPLPLGLPIKNRPAAQAEAADRTVDAVDDQTSGGSVDRAEHGGIPGAAVGVLLGHRGRQLLDLALGQ